VDAIVREPRLFESDAHRETAVARVTKVLLRQFDDDTAYEMLVLETITTAGQAPPGTQHARDDLRGDHVHFARGVFDTVGAGSVAQVIDRFRPLAFGAAYKIIDILVELVMRLNHEPCPRGRWTFVEKQHYVRTAHPVRLPIPLQVPHSQWPRLGALYDRFLEPRHALAHRRSTVQPDGTLVATSRSGSVLLEVSSDEQDAFVHLARELGVAVAAGHADRRQRNRIAWQLDVLGRHHGLRKLGARKPRDVIREVIVNLDPAGPERWMLDGKRVHAHLRGQNESPFDADLVAYGVSGSLLAEYRALCADVPDDTVDFDEAAPPSWLRRI